MKPFLTGGIPFRNLGARERENLGMLAIAIFYLMYLLWALATSGLFAGVGGDYLGFWSAGVVANKYGYAQVYDLKAMKGIEEGIVPSPHDPSLAFVPMPAPFLPVFVLPFQILALLDARVSFWGWTIVNAALLVWYLHFFVKKTCDSDGKRFLPAAILSFPVFATLFEGQVNVFLVICIGEFLRAMLNNRSVRAGLWLGGLLLKPQFLILIPLIMLWQRSWKALLGFLIGAGTLLGVSLGLAGKEGLVNMAQLWLGYSEGIGTNAPENMMNWRMVIVRLSTFTTPFLGWSVGIVGILLSLIASFSLWRTFLSPTSLQYRVALLGTLAGTGAITWHAHAHTLVMLIPPFLLLLDHYPWCKQGWNLLVFSLPLAAFGGLVTGLLVRLKALPSIDRPEGLFIALTALGLNLYILARSLQTLERWRREGSTDSSTLQESFTVLPPAQDRA